MLIVGGKSSMREEFMPTSWSAMFDLGLNNAPTTQEYKDNRFVAS